MIKLTIEDIYIGNKYSILNAALEEYIERGLPKKYGKQTWMDMLLIKHTLILTEKLRGDDISISEMFAGEETAEYLDWTEYNDN